MTVRTLAQALADIDSAVRAFAGVRALTSGELASYKRAFAAGWEIPGLIASSDLTLRVLAPVHAPYLPVRIAVSPAPALLSWPHLEEHGLLCLLPDDATHSTNAPGRLTLDLLDAGRTLVEQCLSGANVTDFEDEFLSYWNRWPKRKTTIVSLCRHDGGSRWVQAWLSTKQAYLADTQADLESWLRRRYEELPSKLEIKPVPFLRLARAPRPSEYPGSVAELLDLVGDGNASLVRDHLLDSSASTKTILAVAKTRRGQALFGFRVIPPTEGGRRGSQGIKKGFRTTPPESVVLQRFSGFPVLGAEVIRVDGSWVHGRDQNIDQPRLAAAHVVVLGVGSLGGGIATLLAKAGVGSITLVDPGVLHTENASRHELGIDAQQKNKAQALMLRLQRELPHLRVEGYPMSAIEFATKHPTILADADLVVSATAAWASECWLNAWSMENRSSRPTLFAWMEPYASVGHAVLTFGAAPCVRCLFDEVGRLSAPATHWRERTTRDIPGCGGEFQPYGAIEMGYCQDLVAGLALEAALNRVTLPTHRVWFSRASYVLALGGERDPAWIDRYGAPGEGGAMREINFAVSEECAEHERR